MFEYFCIPVVSSIDLVALLICTSKYRLEILLACLLYLSLSPSELALGLMGEEAFSFSGIYELS